MEEEYSFIVQYPGSPELLQELYQPDWYVLIDNRYAIVFYRQLTVERGSMFLYHSVPKCYGLMQDEALQAMGIYQVLALPGYALYGQGVILGFVDTGIDFRDPAFIGRDQSSAILSIWDQTEERLPTQGGETVPFGRVYSREELTEALASDAGGEQTVTTKDTAGHGTMLASVAAGREDTASGVRGVAPFADIAMVKLRQANAGLRDYWRIYTDAECYAESDIMLGIHYLTELAKKEGKPLVVCVSVGTNSGGHNGIGFLEEYISALSLQPGRQVVVAAGNEANQGHHFRQIYTEEVNLSEYKEMQLYVGKNERGFTMELWSTAPNRYTVSFLSPGGEMIPRIPARPGTNETIFFLLEGTRVMVSFVWIESRSGDYLILFRFEDAAEGVWTIRVYEEQSISRERALDVWLPITQFLNGETKFLRADPDITVTGPGNAISSMTVGAYNSRTDSITPESGRGFTRTGEIKPDLAAPGVDVPVRAEGTVNGYALATGSSIAAACAAGANALLFEWSIVRGSTPAPLSGRVATALFINGAGRGQRGYPNREWGYGTINLFGLLEALR